MSGRRAGLVVLCAALLGPGAIAAQTPPSDSTLLAALRLVTEGRGDSARALVRARLRQVPQADSLYPQALFVAGTVAGQIDSATHYFRRVALEYSASPWADDALLRMAQLAFATGDHATAERHANRILDDYPFSDVRAAAAYWGGRVQLERDSLPGACALLRQAAAEAGDDVELANRVQFYLQRCASVTIADSAPAAARPAARPAPAPTGAAFSVQVAAVRSAAAADEVMRTLRAAGFDSRVVRDADGLLKVRVGRFRTRAEAQRIQEQLRQRLGGQPFIVEEP